MSDLTNKDAEQDTKIAVIDSTLENAIRRIEMVHQRIDKTEEKLKQIEQKVIDNKIWIQRASAIIGAVTFIIGIIVAMPQDSDSKEVNYGNYDSAQQKELL
jgi:hypothetical protein|tara:strand:+ start:287 stop:589 length:303 start_codon:yes stop_codon:yes gene_type:complete